MADKRTKTGARTVVTCYSVFDKFFPVCGMLDYTEGMYHGTPTTPYDVAQQNQIRYVLDEIACTRGTRVMDIGCGNGALLEEAERRGARAVGVTISPEQVALCRRRGLDARLLDYQDIGPEWDHQFDAVIANGPMEHFVQPADAIAGRGNAIYRRFFEICHRAIDPDSPNKRFINTTIYFVRRPDPADLLRSPRAFPYKSDNCHYALLARSFGGFYPHGDQLERCADGYFRLTKTVDGTYDYHLTSEHWLRTIRAALKSPKLLRILATSLPVAIRHPRQFATMVQCMLVSESWNWQFREPDAPTKLLRQTWEYCPRDDHRPAVGLQHPQAAQIQCV